jgi:hypothetical protein
MLAVRIGVLVFEEWQLESPQYPIALAPRRKADSVPSEYGAPKREQRLISLAFASVLHF